MNPNRRDDDSPDPDEPRRLPRAAINFLVLLLLLALVIVNLMRSGQLGGD